MQVKFRSVSVVVFVAIAGLVSAPADAAKKKFKAGYQGSLVSEFTDNLFHLSDDQFDEFDLLQAPGERYFDMDDPEDVVNRLRLKAELKWRLDKRRDFRVSFTGSYYAHLENSVSDYPRLDVGFRYDATRDDRIYGEIDQVFDRFWKNYRVANTATFAPASYDQAVIRLGYERKINKHWTLGGEYRNQNRDYDAPLASRDRDGDYLAALSSYDLGKRAQGETVIHYGEVETPVELDNGVPEDRSFTEWSVEQAFRFKPAKKVRLELGLEFRQRNASTDFSQDLARFDRVDERLRLKLGAERKLGKSLTIDGRLTWTDNDSERIDPTIQTDEVGYDETALRIGLRYEF